jgi:hypothetical protein
MHFSLGPAEVYRCAEGVTDSRCERREDVIVISPDDLCCPRCGSATTEEYYGPCSTCRGQLRSEVRGEPRAVTESFEYVPKMNVTPNAVALRDD